MTPNATKIITKKLKCRTSNNAKQITENQPVQCIKNANSRHTNKFTRSMVRDALMTVFQYARNSLIVFFLVFIVWVIKREQMF